MLFRSPGELIEDRCGTPAYVGPEVLGPKPFNGILADIWSAGVVLYSMLYGEFPFHADNEEKLKAAIVNSKIPMKGNISVNAMNLVNRILCKSPEQRPSIDEILSDPWMRDIDETGKILIT